MSTGFAHNARNRYLETTLNGAGIFVGIESYEALVGLPEYTEEIQKMIPVMKYDGVTIANNVDSDGKLLNHNLTFTTGIELTQDMIDNPLHQRIYLFNFSSLDTKAKSGDLKDLSNDDFAAVLEINNAATVFGGTLGSMITTVSTKTATQKHALFTHAMILGNDGYVKVAQLVDYNDEETAETIAVDNADSGGYKATIPGLKSGDVGETSGIYDPSFPSLATIATAFDNDEAINLRMGAMKKKNAPYKTGLYKVNDFSTTGAADGSAALQYSAAFSLQPGTLSKKYYVE